MLQEKGVGVEQNDENGFEEGEVDEESDFEQMEGENLDVVNVQLPQRTSQPISPSDQQSGEATSPQIALALHTAQTLASTSFICFFKTFFA